MSDYNSCEELEGSSNSSNSEKEHGLCECDIEGDTWCSNCEIDLCQECQQECRWCFKPLCNLCSNQCGNFYADCFGDFCEACIEEHECGVKP